MSKKKDGKYRDYSMMQGGKLYGSVAIPKGDGTYKLKRKRVASKTEARQWAIEELRKHGLGEGGIDEPKEKKAKGMTFNELAEWYKTEFCVPPVYDKHGVKLYGLRTYKKEILKVDLICRYFGLYRLDAIDVDVLLNYKKKRLSGEIVYMTSKGQKKKRIAGISAINREFACMRTMFIMATNRDWMRKNPFAGNKTLIEIKKEHKRVKMLNDEIADKLIKHAPEVKQPLLADLLTVMRWTGARPSEIFPFGAQEGDGVPREPLCWKNILEFDFKAVRLIEYKDTVRTERVVPAIPELQRCLRSLHARRPLAKEDDLLFPFKSFKRSWATVCEKAGIKSGMSGTVSRDFRAYFNNKLIEWKVPDVVRLMIIGHESVQSNQTYSSITPEFINAFTAEYVSDAVN